MVVDRITVGAVEVVFASLLREWRRQLSGDLWVQLRTSDASDKRIYAALDESNERALPDGVFAQFPCRTPNGIVTMLTRILDRDALQAWLVDFAARLDRSGIAGRLTAVTPARRPLWLDPPPLGPAAFVAWVVDLERMAADEARQRTWNVDSKMVERVCQLTASWTAGAGPEIQLSSGIYSFVVLDGAAVPSILSSAVAAIGRASVLRYAREQRRARIANHAFMGQSVLQDIDASIGWQERVEALRAAIVALPQDCEQAFLRPAQSALSWMNIDTSQPLVGIDESDVRYNRHLLRTYLPDAHGVQVMTEEHLARAHDLSRWAIRDLGHGRYLVEHADLDAWYSSPLPQPDVVAEARRDFGDLILTRQTIASNPPLWGR